MLDLRQRALLWGVWAAGAALVLFVGLPVSMTSHGGIPWSGERLWALTTWQKPRFGDGSLPLEDRILAAAQRYGVDPALIAAVIRVESGFRPDVVSARGAQGLMQVMPDTAALLGPPESADVYVSIEIGTKYLGALLEQFGGDVELALAAYNAGPGAVRRWGTVPPFRETREFVRRVSAAYAELTGLELRAAARLTASSNE